MIIHFKPHRFAASVHPFVMLPFAVAYRQLSKNVTLAKFDLFIRRIYLSIACWQLASTLLTK